MSSTRRTILITLGAIAAIIVVIWVGRWLQYRLTHVTSDAGFVKADLIELTPLVRGHVKEILVDEGKRVEAGQVLLTIDDRDYQQQLKQAEAAFIRAELAYLRAQKLHVARVIANAKFEDVEAAYKEATAALEIARLNVGHTVITAPTSGIIAKRHVEPGDYAGPGLPVLAIYDPETLHIIVNLEESKVKNVRLGAKADLFFEASNDILKGEVVRIGEATAAEFALIPRDVSAGEFTRVVQRVPIKISVPDKTKYPFLRPGLSVTIGITKG
jgi:membrane fusion protein (multidrug efflux system)